MASTIVTYQSEKETLVFVCNDNEPYECVMQTLPLFFDSACHFDPTKYISEITWAEEDYSEGSVGNYQFNTMYCDEPTLIYIKNEDNK